MSRESSVALTIAFTFVSAALAQSPDARARLAAPPPALLPAHAGAPAPLPGSRPGTQRWLVHFANRSFDLEGLRAATMARKPAAEIAAIIADLDRCAHADQEPFVRALERLDGVVLAQWWLVNGCAIEIHAGAVDTVRALPDVARLEPDALAEPAIKTTTNALNHNADAVHAAGFRGESVTVAIMDSGFDCNMNNIGRPHRTFFVDGDPTNMTGGGIAGSRMLVCRQIGLLSPDTVAGHGTQVAACAAGANWGTVHADHGHAYGSKLAVYSISDQPNSGSSFTTMTTAWQTIAADRTMLNIVAANNSYQATGGGLHDPLNMVQQALDAAAYASDILITAPAGNGGAMGAVGQSAANGIVCAAVYRDSHKMSELSGRGPHAYDPQRHWPDLSAVGMFMVVPFPDCETSNGSVNGTSFPAPQICGAGALLRSANPNLRADETKAILLASASDIAARNPDPPYNTRNAYGMGLLRDDVALATLRPGRYGWARLTSANPRHTFTVSVTAGTDYALAITWHRKVMTSTAWSNLDLRVLDGTTLVAASATPRNLYEMVRFRAAQTATYTVEVDAPFIEGADQEFAFALADSLTLPPAGRFETFGTGCSGSGGPGATGPVCAGANTGELDLNPFRFGENLELVWREFTTTPLTVTGCSVLTYTALPAPVTVGLVLYLTDAAANPLPQPIATASMTIGTQPAWYGASFPMPVQIPASASFCVGWVLREVGVIAPVPRAGTDTRVQFRRRLFCTQTWENQGAQVRAYRVHCAGTLGPRNPPVLMHDGIPAPGNTFTLRLAHAQPNALAVLFTGVSRTQWGNLVLPADLGPLGAPTCFVRASGEIALPLAADSGGRAALPLQLPNNQGLLGAQLYQQVLATDAINALGLVATNSGVVFIGLAP